MFIVDAHEDIAYNALEWGRDIRLSAYTVRSKEAAEAKANGKERTSNIAMSGLPELRRGGFGMVFGVIFAHPLLKGMSKEQCHTQCYRNVEEAYRVGQGQLDYYRELAEEPGVVLVQQQSDLQELIMAWENSREDDEERPFGIVPLMEGADPIRTPDEAEEWFKAGLRIVGLAWATTRYGGGTYGLGPLTSAGKALLAEMERVGLILDTTHMSEETFWQSLQHFSGPVIASHSNCRSITMGKSDLSNEADRVLNERLLSDDMIRELAERDGVIGIVPFNRYLNVEWSSSNRFEMGLDQVVRQIDHICQLTGNALHVGIGSDIDGGFGRDETPRELDTVADIAKLADALRQSGYQEEDVTCIMGGNWQRLLEQSLPQQS